MRRLTTLAAAAVLVLGMASCTLDDVSLQSGEKVQGQEIIESAMRRYDEQNSGGYEAVNNITGKLQERFIYHYDEVGFLTFLCETYGDDGNVYKEYNTGYAVYIEEDGIGSRLSKKDDRFIAYNNNISKHTKATDAVFGFLASGIEKVDITEAEDGSVQYTYIYDVDKAGVGASGGKLLSYSITYEADSSGEIFRFRQQASGSDDSGEEFRYDYTVTLLPSDSVGLIDNPIKVSDASADTGAEK